MIYFAQINPSDGPIKIGFTRGDPKRRLSVLQRALPWSIVLLGVVEGGLTRERWLHVHLADFCMKSEWFRPTESVSRMIAQALCGELAWPDEQMSVERHPTALGLYMRENRHDDETFAKEIGAKPRAVKNWRLGIRIPRSDEMREIHRATNGAVEPNDFYDVPADVIPVDNSTGGAAGSGGAAG